MDELRVLQLTRYDRLGGSSRLRFYDYQTALATQGIIITDAPFFDDDYLQRLYAGKPASLAKILLYYVRRLHVLLSAHKYDLVWLEKEALPWLPALVEMLLLRKSYVIDFDDAWFHRYDQHRNPIMRRLLKNKFPKLVRNATAVIAGSPYLADWAQKNGAQKIVRIPTTVDLARYQTKQDFGSGFVIGWMGSPSTASYLKKIDGALLQINGADIHLVGSGPIDLSVPHRVSDWNEDSEIAALAGFDVGIMPLESDLWSEGKCAYKLIQYMAAGLPVIASPVGMNREVVQHGINGFLAGSDREWITALETLRDDPALRSKMGQAGRKIVEERYSLAGNKNTLAQTLREAGGETMKHLVIFGAAGQVGRSITRLAEQKGFTIRAYVREDVDITHADDVARAIESAGFVVNCAAYTAVDKAESEQDAAFAANATAPGIMAAACREQDIPLLHISTDYVFGEPIGRPWREDDPIAPLNAYGHGKAAGEKAVQGTWHKHLILRTAWVYDSEGKNFVLTMLRLGADRPELKVVGDQEGSPTSAEDIAHAILRMVGVASDPSFTGWGIYHFSGAPPTTWFDFATAIFKGKGPKLIRITTADYPTPARRSPYSVLDCSKIASEFGIQQPDWRKSLDKVLEVIGNPG